MAPEPINVAGPGRRTKLVLVLALLLPRPGVASRGRAEGSDGNRPRQRHLRRASPRAGADGQQRRASEASPPRAVGFVRRAAGAARGDPVDEIKQKLEESPFGGTAAEQRKKPLMTGINVMRAQLCWSRQDIWNHQECLLFLGLRCKKEQTGMTICSQFLTQAEDKCGDPADRANLPTKPLKKFCRVAWKLQVIRVKTTTAAPTTTTTITTTTTKTTTTITTTTITTTTTARTTTTTVTTPTTTTPTTTTTAATTTAAAETTTPTMPPSEANIEDQDRTTGTTPSKRAAPSTETSSSAALRLPLFTAAGSQPRRRGPRTWTMRTDRLRGRHHQRGRRHRRSLRARRRSGSHCSRRRGASPGAGGREHGR
ncbi:unnamed protein product [Prorocentrum cordatum]|uniref:Uncharacterized protein n=1 Tax=Prorocentrum cordatum TaxID=2364126 RepID=A0ABN9U1G4_9DINO|nr:unnamed protein product [Polarella glacialis]